MLIGAHTKNKPRLIAQLGNSSSFIASNKATIPITNVTAAANKSDFMTGILFRESTNFNYKLGGQL